MSGTSGSGKSYHSVRLAEKTGAIRLSSDELRAILGTSESDLTVSDKVFQVMKWMTDYFLKSGKSVIIDATMLNIKARAPFIALAKKHNVTVNVVLMDVSLEECQKRNAARERKVPDYVIVNQYNRLERPNLNEVDKITVITT